MLQSYAGLHGFTNCVHYTDDGWSSGNFDRPAWKQLVADIEAGKVAAVLVKDMSRIGRDYLQTGYFTEVLFQQHEVRFIAIANKVDSDNPSSNEFTPFMNIMNEWYLRDQSRKMRAAVQQKGRAGKPITTNAPYGYKKDPADHNHWLIDDEAAAVVRHIFHLSINGHGPYEIANILMREQVETPGYYFSKRSSNAGQGNGSPEHRYDWHGGTVLSILGKPEYMGHTVNFRTYRPSYKSKRAKRNDPDKWVIFENTHEAIVDADTWRLAQHEKGTKTRIDSVGLANPLTGLVFCADCGEKMYNSRLRKEKNNDAAGLSHDTYNCSTYTLTRVRETKVCSNHHISTQAIRTLLLDGIRKLSQYAVTDPVGFAKKIRADAKIQQEAAAKALKKQLAKARKRRAELDTTTPATAIPHVHLMLTMRAMDEQGRWLPKTKTTYVLDENGERTCGVNGRWLRDRINTVDWNDQKYAEIWRHEWELAQNNALEAAGHTERIDMRSYERQGITHLEPQIHLGPEVAALERKGIPTTRGERNREIKRVNAIIVSLQKTIAALVEWLQSIKETLTRHVTISNPGARMNELCMTVRSKEQRIRDIDALLAADKTIHDLQPVYDEYSAIRWKGAKERFATIHADDLEQYKKAQRLLHKFGLSHPIDRKPLRAEKTQLEQEVEALRPDLDAVQAELDELKTVRYWVRKVIPDALPSRTESGAPSLRNTMEESQNQNELNDLLERTAKQAIAPQQEEVYRQRDDPL